VGDSTRCYLCHLDIEMRYGLVPPKSSAPGYWAHMGTVAGIAADGDHDAVR
jgi:hypothetical protein